VQVDLDVTGRKVVVLGTAGGARRAVARFVRGGTNVTLVATDGLPAARLHATRVIDHLPERAGVLVPHGVADRPNP
jgi:uroporphyrin-III C-methyltransferase